MRIVPYLYLKSLRIQNKLRFVLTLQLHTSGIQVDMPDWVGDFCLQGPQRAHETTNYAHHKLTTTQRHQTLSYGLTACNPKCKIQMPEDT